MGVLTQSTRVLAQAFIRVLAQAIRVLVQAFIRVLAQSTRVMAQVFIRVLVQDIRVLAIILRYPLPRLYIFTTLDEVYTIHVVCII